MLIKVLRELAVLGLLASCTDPSPPTTIDSAHIVITIRPRLQTLPLFPHPNSLTGILALEVNADGSAAGSLAIPGKPSSLAEVSGRLSGGRLTLDPGQVAVARGSTLAWNTLTLASGAANLVGSSGTAAGTWTMVGGDVVEDTAYTAELSATADTGGEAFDVTAPEARPLTAILPTDVLQLRLGEPVEVAGATAVQVLANGLPVVGSPVPLGDPVHGLVTTLAIRPQGFWAFDTVFAAEPSGLVDPSGNAMLWSDTGLRVVADPGPAIGNLGFEAGATGWTTTGHEAGATGEYNGILPVEGARQMVVREQSVLAGYVDVPADAVSLSLAVGLLSETGEMDPDRTAVVALHRASGERIVVFDGFAERIAGAPCACGGGFRHRILPMRKTADLTRLRGERLFLTAEVHSSFFIGVNNFALVLDDLRLE